MLREPITCPPLPFSCRPTTISMPDVTSAAGASSPTAISWPDPVSIAVGYV